MNDDPYRTQAKAPEPIEQPVYKLEGAQETCPVCDAGRVSGVRFCVGIKKKLFSRVWCLHKGAHFHQYCLECSAAWVTAIGKDTSGMWLRKAGTMTEVESHE